MNKEQLKARIAETENDFITIYTRPSKTERDRRIDLGICRLLEIRAMQLRYQLKQADGN